MLTITAIEQRLAARAPDQLAAKHYAAVAIVVVNTANPEVLLIRRAEHEGDPWSGQMAFPGGRHDPDDGDLFTTAVREAREEVGVDLGNEHWLGCLDDIPAVAGGRPTEMIIRPFVFHLGEKPALSLDPTEVAGVIWARANQLASGTAESCFHYERLGAVQRLPAYDVEGHTVWGLTYRMLTSLIAIAKSA